jgi:hypothetical protein
MTIHLDVPEELARRIAPDDASLTRVALEALAVGGVRSGRLSVFEARTLLGVRSRYEIDGILKAHGVLLDLTVDDVRKDAEAAIASSR